MRRLTWAIFQLLLLSSAALADEAGKISNIIVSDVDDTVKLTDVRHRLDALIRAFFSHKAFAGMSTLYGEMMSRNPGTTLYFVTGSPVQLADEVNSLLELNRFPKPYETAFRKFSQPTPSFKIERISELAQSLPQETRLILVGDDGQKDPETYAALREKFPDRIAEIYIHRIVGRSIPNDEIAYDSAMDIAFAEMKRGALDPDQVIRVGNATLDESAKDPETLVMRYSYCSEQPGLESPVLVSGETPSEELLKAIDLRNRIRDRAVQICKERRIEAEYRQNNRS